MMRKWSIVRFGKYKGMTLPQILLKDPDWFFWIAPKLYGRLRDEANELVRKAKAIKIPGARRKKKVVEYKRDDQHPPRFLGFQIVEANSYMNGKYCTRSKYLDLSFVRRSRPYDKAGSRRLVRDFCRNYFGRNKRLTRRRCEAFFNNERNFA
jgi:hypothetical protein